MTKTFNQDFLRGTDQEQVRVVYVVAGAVIAVATVVVLAISWIYPRIESNGALALNVDVPYVAPGVDTGTKVILRGVEVGTVTGLDKIDEGVVRMGLSLNPDQIHGLTDAFDIDFRPENYFGVTAVNIVGRSGGGELAGGEVLNRAPAGDFTMSTMLEKGSLAVDGTLTASMIATLDKIIRYTDGLTPMIQTGVVLADRLSATQQAIPSRLLDDLNHTLDVTPAFDSQMIVALYNMYDNKFNRRPDGSHGLSDSLFDNTDQGLYLTANSLFGAAGHLLASHGSQLTPVAGIVQAYSDIVPDLLDGGAAAGKLGTLIDSYNKIFTGQGDAKTLDLRIIVDELPMFAAPLAVSGSQQSTHQGATR